MFDFRISKTGSMINDTQVRDLITTEIPRMAIDLSLLKDNSSICRAMACFADYTCYAIQDHDIDEVLACFDTAYELLSDGSETVKNTVINVYVNSVSRLVECTQTVEDHVRMKFMRLFGEEYFSMIYASNP